MSWTHCNKCFVTQNPSVKLHMTSCGHIACKKCIDLQGNQNHCIKCKSLCQYILLNPYHLEPQIKEYFRPINDSFKSTQQIAAFQQENIRSLSQHYNLKNEYLKSELYKLQQEYNVQRKKQVHLKNYLHKLSNNNQASGNNTKSLRQNFFGDDKNNFLFPNAFQSNVEPYQYCNSSKGSVDDNSTLVESEQNLWNSKKESKKIATHLLT